MYTKDITQLFAIYIYKVIFKLITIPWFFELSFEEKMRLF